MSRGSFLIMVAVLSASCGKSSQDCQADVADLTEWVKPLGREPPSVATRAKLVLRRDLEEPISEAMVLELVPAGAFLDGKPIERSALETLLVEDLMARTKAGASPKPAIAVLFAIDESTPWRTVVDWGTDATNAGFNKVGFVFSVPPSVPPPPHTSVDDEVAKLTSDTRASGLARILRNIIEPCKQLQDVFDTLATYRTGDKGDILASGLGHALGACKCSVDLPKLRSALYQVFAASPMRVSVVSLKTDAQVVALAGDTPWRDAGKLLVPGSTTWLATK